MAQKKRYAADDIEVVWFAPEQVRAERIQQAVKDGATAQEVADLASGPAEGEYREYLGEEEIDGKIQGKFGDRFVWKHPDGADDGYYERHTEGDDYRPVLMGADAEA